MSRTHCTASRIREAHAITKCDCIKGMLPTQPCYFDDSKDSEDEGWLRDGHMKYRPATPMQGLAAFMPQRVEVLMDPTDLPE